jgi:hypothetical protein
VKGTLKKKAQDSNLFKKSSYERFFALDHKFTAFVVSKGKNQKEQITYNYNEITAVELLYNQHVSHYSFKVSMKDRNYILFANN